MSVTDYTAARINSGIATLYAGQALATQLISQANIVEVSEVSRGGSVVKDFVPLTDGSTTALTTNVVEAASGSQPIVPVTFTMLEYGKGTDAVVFPWRQFLTRAENPEAYAKVIESVANKAITAVDQLAHVPLRDTIAAGTNAAYTHPLGPDDLGAGVMGFANPKASHLVRYGTQSESRDVRADITTADVLTWDWIQSGVTEVADRGVRPIFNLGGKKIFAVIGHRHILNDLKKSLTATPVYPDMLTSEMIRMLISQGIGVGLSGMFDDVLLIESNRMVYPAAGSGGINVYPISIVGADFLAKAVLAPSAMPQTPSDGDMIPAGDGTCVIVQPSYDGVHSNRTGTCAWYGYVGHGIYDPRSYLRIECASTSARRI